MVRGVTSAYTPPSSGLVDFLATRVETSPAIERAAQSAEEYGLRIPDEVTGRLLSTLAVPARGRDREPAAAQADGQTGPVGPAGGRCTGAIAITPALAAVGSYILAGLPQESSLTCIDTEAENIRDARSLFPGGRARFLTARPLSVLSRMAPESYHLIYADIAPTHVEALVDATWPLLIPGGTLALADALLDGTLTDESRSDRTTAAARATFDRLSEWDPREAVVAHLPLGAGMTLVTRR